VIVAIVAATSVSSNHEPRVSTSYSYETAS
jgi:hypothetical protein